MPDAPDVVLCSKLCRHNPTDLNRGAMDPVHIFRARSMDQGCMFCTFPLYYAMSGAMIMAPDHLETSESF